MRLGACASAGWVLLGIGLLASDPVSAGAVARVGDRIVTASEVQEVVRRTGAVPYDPIAVRRVAEGLVDEAVLAQEARRLGLDRDPVLRAEWDRRLADRLVQEAVDGPMAQWVPDEEVIRDWQQRHADRMRGPDRVSVCVLSLWLDSRGTNGLAERLRAVEAGLSQGQSLSQLARQWADGPGERAGETFVFVEGRDSLRQPPEVIAAALALTTPGQRSGPIRTARGWSLLELRERQAGIPLSEEKGRQAAVQALRSERRTAALAKLVEGVRRREGIEINAAAVSSVVVKTDARPPRAPAAPR